MRSALIGFDFGINSHAASYYVDMEELYKLIPTQYAQVIRSRLSTDKLCEVRLRNNKPVGVCYDGKYRYLCATGLTKAADESFVAPYNACENVVMQACEHSLYTVNDTVCNGYIAVAGGIRIGVCGSAIFDGEKIKTIKDFSSVNIRLPHQVYGCASALYLAVKSANGVYNTLIASEPGGGKTTYLRDLTRLISDNGLNVALCDEKYELAAVVNGSPTLDVGVNTDVICGMDKHRCFEMGVAYLRPHVIMADELFAPDMEFVLRAVRCGVSVVATVHACDIRELNKKPELKPLIDAGVFERYCVIANRRARVYDSSFNEIWA